MGLLPPEELPGVVLEVAHELLHVVVDLFIHHERADGALAFLDVGDDRLRVGRRRVGALGELCDVGQRLADLVLLLRRAHRRRDPVEVRERLAMETEEPALSVSAGIAAYPEDGDTAEKLLGSADRVLYRMKRRGTPMNSIARIAACL